jgi:hypothetical protein
MAGDEAQGLGALLSVSVSFFLLGWDFRFNPALWLSCPCVRTRGIRSSSVRVLGMCRGVERRCPFPNPPRCVMPGRIASVWFLFLSSPDFPSALSKKK